MGNPGAQVESRLPAGRQAFIDLNEAMLASDAAQDLGEEGISLLPVEVDIDPEKAERELRASPLGAVMLGEGRPLLRSHDDLTDRERYVIVGHARPSAVEVTAFARSWTSTPPFKVSDQRTHYSRRGVGVRLWYGERTDDQKGDAAQHLRVASEFNTYENRVYATISRLVVASPRLVSKGVNLGRNEKERQRSPNDRKLLLAAQTIGRLFELRTPE